MTVGTCAVSVRSLPSVSMTMPLGVSMPRRSYFSILPVANIHTIQYISSGSSVSQRVTRRRRSCILLYCTQTLTSLVDGGGAVDHEGEGLVSGDAETQRVCAQARLHAESGGDGGARVGAGEADAARISRHCGVVA